MKRRRDEKMDNTHEMIDFLKSHTCYDLLPQSSRVVVFDSTLPIVKAFYALLQNEIRAAPIWSSETGTVVGMLTVTDFINILRFYHNNPPPDCLELEEQLIETWKTFESGGPLTNQKLFSLDPMRSLYEATKILLVNRIHRVPLIDKIESQNESTKENVIGVITQFKILRFLAVNYPSFDWCLDQTPQSLGVGRYSQLQTITMDTSLNNAINLLTQHRISALPIVDGNGIALDVFDKYDVTYLARTGAQLSLDMPVKTTLQHRIEGNFEGVHTITVTDTMRVVLDIIKSALIHRLLVISDTGVLQGIVSVSDLLNFFLGEINIP